MRSLIRKAERYLETLEPAEARRRLTVVRRDSLAVRSDDDITPEEREKIDAQIEQAVASSRIAVTPDALRVTPRKRGGVLPLVVNVVAVAIVASGVLLSLYLFRRSEESIVSTPVVLETAEGKLLDAVKQESREQLEGKDREIAGIREKLAGVDQEKERIRREAADRVRAREQELQSELERAIEAERTKLRAQGLSDDAVARRLQELESRSRTELSVKLDEYRAQAEAQRAEQERTAERLRQEYERSLGAAQGERARLEEESRTRQAALEAGYREKQLALEKDKASAMAELDTLRRLQEREQLVLDQILSFYRRASEEVRGARLGSARAVLAEFRRYLDEPSVASIESIARRRSVELFLIGSLEEAIATRESAASTASTVQSLTASANLIAAVASLVEQGDALYRERDYVRARELYLSAMARVPAVQVGYARLAEIEELSRARGGAEVARLFGEANASYRAGDYARAVQGYRAALQSLETERGAVDALLAQLQEIGARTREAELAPRLLGAQRDLEARTRELAVSQADVATLRAEVAKRDAAQESGASLSSSAGATPDPALEKLRADVATREATIASLAADVARLQGTVAGLEGTNAGLGDEVATLRESLQSRDAEARALAVRVGEREATIATLAANVAGSKGQTESLRSDVAGLEASLERREAQIAELESRESARLGRAGAVIALRSRAAGAVEPQAAASSRAALMALLETKLLVQRILLSDEVLAEYPDLYDGLERYLDALVAEKQTEARTQTLRDLDTMLGRLLGESGEDGEAVARYAPADQNALLLGILDKLGKLVR